MQILLAVLAVIAVLILVVLALSLRIVQQYEEGVLFRLGRVVGQKKPGLVRIVPVIDEGRGDSARLLERAGHGDVAVLAGGPADWSRATGLPLEPARARRQHPLRGCLDDDPRA